MWGKMWGKEKPMLTPRTAAKCDDTGDWRHAVPYYFLKSEA
jgi:hypothetical protein